MLTRGTAFIAAVVIAAGLTAQAPLPRTDSCTGNVALVGACGSTDGSSLTITGTQQQPGTDARPADPGAEDSQNSPSTPGARSGPSDEAVRFAECMDDQGTTRCARELNTPGAPETAPQAPGEPGIPAITITDLAQFAPAPTAAAAEPGNVGIAGLPTNFVSAADVQVRDGELFGQPLSVRFTPVAYDYTYGDGDIASLATAGKTWQALRQPQFSPTATSHTYRSPGVYPASVDVRYAAEVDLGSGWQRVAGELTTHGAAQSVRVLTARTALVAHTCIETPAAAGC